MKLRGDIPTDLPAGMRMELARRHAQMTQADMAAAIQLAPLSINRYERGLRAPKAHVLMAWAAVTGVDLTWLETGEVPSPGGDGTSVVVRHQGLEPRTRWFGVWAGSYLVGAA